MRDISAPTINRCYRETQVAAGIEHPNICSVHDVGQADGIHFLTMPYIDGMPLARALDPAHPWPVSRAAALAVRVTLALHAMHQKGFIHRDLKPANIMLRNGDEPVIFEGRPDARNLPLG